MQFQKISTPSLKDLFVKELENKILSGELKVGDKLPSERELASSMQVSRAVVNAGIAELEQKGFLIIKPRIGTFVENFYKNGTLETFSSIVRYNGGTLAKDETRSILEMRIILVNMACSLAIDNASDDELLSLRTISESINDTCGNEEIVEKTFDLYHQLAFISGNVLLPLVFTSFKDLVCKLWLRFILNNDKQTLILSNDRLVSFIIARDKESAHTHITDTSNEAISGKRSLLHTELL